MQEKRRAQRGTVDAQLEVPLSELKMWFKLVVAYWQGTNTPETRHSYPVRYISVLPKTCLGAFQDAAQLDSAQLRLRSRRHLRKRGRSPPPSKSPGIGNNGFESSTCSLFNTSSYC